MKEKISTPYQIKKRYLRKLSMELIKRGASNEDIKALLDEVSFSVDDYISEFKPRDLEELENKFGSPEDFCDNNSIIRSKVASLGQLFLIGLMISSILVVPVLSILSLFLISTLPNAVDFRLAQTNWINLGVNGVNTGYGIIGTIFGLNVFVWMLYQYFKDKFSSYDIRESIKGALLGLYWYLVVFCLYLILNSYISHYVIIPEMWNHNMELLILEGIFRWISLESVLLITAIGYTHKFRNQYHRVNNVKQGIYFIDKIGILVVVFILTGFISAGPSIGILMLVIGLGAFFLTKITGKTWFLGLVAILLQLGFLLTKMIESFQSYPYSTRVIIFGIETGNIDDYLIFVAILTTCLAIVWSVMCVKKIKKDGRKLFPRLSVPKGKKAFISLFLVTLSLVAVLGTQPQRVRYASNYYFNEEVTYFEFDSSLKFQKPGKISMSIYTYIEEGYRQLAGSWYLMWTPTEAVFRTFRIEGNFDNYTSPSYNSDFSNVSITFISLRINESGILRYHITIYKEGMTIQFPYLQMQYSAVVPWFSNWYDIVIFVCVVAFVFSEWDENTIQLLSKNKKGDD